MATVPLFRDTKMGAVTSRKNTPYRKSVHWGIQLAQNWGLETFHLENRSILNFKHVTSIYMFIL